MKQAIIPKKMAFFFMLAVALGARPGFSSDCGILSDDFSNIFSFTSTYQTKNANWSVSNGSLYCTNITQGKSAVAVRSFDPTGPFSADIDMDVASSDSSSYVGLYVYTDGDVFFETDGITVDGVEVIIFPQSDRMYFYVWDVVNGKWKQKGPYSISGQLDSFGLAFTDDKVVFRQNGQDTEIVLNGTFAGFDTVLDRLWIEAGGTNTSVYFDNLCISSYSPGDIGPGNGSNVTGGGAEGLALPTTKTSYSVMPAAEPDTQGSKDQLVPFGLGSAASGGTTLDLEVALPGYQAPVDIYLGVNISTYPDTFFLFNQANEIVSLDQAFVPWRAGVRSPMDAFALKGIPVSLLGPNVRLTFFLLVLPSGTTSFDAYDLWVTAIDIGTGETGVNGGNSSSGSDNSGGGGDTTSSVSGLKGEVTSVMDQVMSFLPAAIGLYDDLSGMLDGDSSSDIITITPSDINLFDLPTNMTVDIDFGSGYRLKDGSILTGTGRLLLSNIEFNSSSLGADFTFTAHEIKKDGQELIDGAMSGAVSLSGSGDENTLNGNITFSGLKLKGQEVRGGLVITGHNIDTGEGTFQDIVVQPSSLQYGGVTVSSGSVTVRRPSTSIATIDADLNTSRGPVTLSMSVAAAGASGYEWNTISQGQVMGYGVVVQGLFYDSSVCEDYPIGGSITLTKGSESGTVSFTNACDGTYNYTE